MLGIDRRAAQYVWTGAAILLLLAALYLIRTTLFVFIVALLFAYLLSPVVEMLDRFLPTSRTRTPALVVAYLLLIGVLVLAGIGIGSHVVEQANKLITAVPEWLNPSSPPVQAQTWVDSVKSSIQAQLRQRAGDFVSYLPRAGKQALAIASNLVWIVIVPILSFFFLKDGPGMRDELLGLINEGPGRALVEDILKDMDVLLAQYMRALTVLSLFTLTFYSFYLSVTRVPYALLLSVVSGMLEFIPVIGPFTAAVTITVVAGFSGYQHLIWILAFLGLYRLFQDYVLSPRLMSEGVELHPLIVMFGVFAGGEIGGIPGTFLSVPILALVRILYRRLEKARHPVAQLTS